MRVSYAGYGAHKRDVKMGRVFAAFLVSMTALLVVHAFNEAPPPPSPPPISPPLDSQPQPGNNSHAPRWGTGDILQGCDNGDVLYGEGGTS